MNQIDESNLKHEISSHIKWMYHKVDVTNKGLDPILMAWSVNIIYNSIIIRYDDIDSYDDKPIPNHRHHHLSITRWTIIILEIVDFDIKSLAIIRFIQVVNVYEHSTTFQQ